MVEIRGLISITWLADELDVEEVVELELGDDPARRCPSARGRRASGSTWPARPASPRASSGGRARSGRPTAIPSIVRSAAGRELHHEQLGRRRRRAARRSSSSRSASATPGRFSSSCSRRSAEAESDAEAARAGGEDRLEGDVLVRGSRARARRAATASRAATPPPRRPADADRVEQRVGLGLVVRAADRLRATRRARAISSKRPSPRRARAGRRTTAAARRRRARARQISSSASAKPGSAPGRHEVEGVAEVPADRQLGHVRADEPNVALAVLAQRADQRRRSRRAARRRRGP